MRPMQQLSLVALPLALCCGNAHGQNLLMNGGFEDLDDFGFPTSWNEYPGSALATDTQRTGSNAMRVVPVSSLQPGPTQAEHLNPSADPPIAATPGVEYTLSGHALHRSDDSLAGTGHVVGLSIVFYAADTAVTGHTFLPVFDGAPGAAIPQEDIWHECSVTLTAPEGTAGVGVGLSIMANDAMTFTGSAYFDDMELRAAAHPADLNADGAVDSGDLAVMLAAWGPCGAGACGADLDGDGAVSSADLAVLLAAWGV